MYEERQEKSGVVKVSEKELADLVAKQIASLLAVKEK